MKLRVGIGALCWAVLISLLHVHWNVGWGNLRKKVQILRGEERAELVVGFLPVT